MGKKKKALLRYKRLGIISKKLEKKFSNFLQANLEKFNTKVEEVIDKVDSALSASQDFIDASKEEEPVVEKKPKTTRKRKTATKKTPASTTRKRRTTKTKKEA